MIILIDAQVIGDACDELKHSTRLRQLLGIVLQFGNRLNTAGKSKEHRAGAFTLDSLLKLSQAKAFDKKTTFLHYVIMIVHRNNEILLNFTDDLPTVMRADKVYWDQCLQDLEEVENQLENVRRISLHEARVKKYQHFNQDDDDSLGDMELSLEEEVESLRSTPTGLFTLSAIKQVSALRDKVEATRNKFCRALEYFGEDKDSMQPHELFNIFCVFGRDFNKAKDEAFANLKRKQREERKRAGRNQTPNGKHGRPPSVPERKPPSVPEHRTLRASNLQPHMNKVINDFKPPAQRHTNGTAGYNEAPRSNTLQGESDQRGSYRNEQRSMPQDQSNHRSHGDGHHRSIDSSSNQQQASQPHKNEERSLPLNPGHQRTNNGDDHHQYVDSSRNQAQASRAPHNFYGNTPSRLDIHEVPVPRGMQESGRFEDASTSFYSQNKPEAAPSAADSLRQKAKSRRHRQMQIVSGRATPVASNTSAQESRSPRSSPTAAEDNGDTQSLSTHSRTSMRHRRLQAMKRVNASRSAVSS